ncbi:MAG TPA: ABC transporter permease [Usitatibacter sp.]|nr:ABC transporter permease [Usitatibacter sp.]
MIATSTAAAVWRYRGFILGSVKREFQARYRGSMLGSAWNVLNPLAMIAVYTIVFSQLMRARLPGVDSTFAYSIYLCAGILSWGLFTEIVSRGQNVFLENANLIKKLSFPRICLPVVVVLSAALNFAIIFGLFTAFLLATHNFPGVVYVALLPVLVVQVAFAIGLGVILGVLNVFFRDVGQFFGIVLQFWFWLTPIVYSQSILPEAVRPLMAWNPMAAIVTAYQDVLVNAAWPRWASLIPVTVLSIVLCLFAVRLFLKRSGEMVDEL